MIRCFLALFIELSGLYMSHAQTNKRVHQGAFDVIGIAARTTNLDEAGPNGVIPRFWRRLMAEGLLDHIPNRIDTETIAVYTEYASDEKGAYTFVLGARVKPDTVAPEGMRSIHIPAADYVIFPTERGPVEKVVPQTWQTIWNSFPPDGPMLRAFQADFELYGKAAMDPKNSQVFLYVGIK
jgi:predicted transcriptional regulator YdeE